MRIVSSVLLAGLLIPAAASGQSDPICDVLGGERNAGAPADIAEPGFNIFLQLPASGATNVPLNPVMRIGGFLQDLEGPEPFMRIVFTDDAGTPVPFTRVGGRMVPDTLLQPNTFYRFSADFTDGGCEGCFGFYEFQTGASVDETAPQLTTTPDAHVFIDDACNSFNGSAAHTIALALRDLDADVAWLEVAVAREDIAPRKAFAGAIFNRAVQDFFLGGDQNPMGLDEAVRIAITPVDMAGHVGESITVRTRARSMQDLNDVFGVLGDLEPLSCELPGSASPAGSAAIPAGGLVDVNFPFEATPVALDNGERRVALIPMNDTASGQRLLPAEDLTAGSWELVAEPCVFCACAGCASATGTIEVAAGADAAAPAAPVILGLEEDLDPAYATETCFADDPALLVSLELGEDDATDPMDLRYHASLRVEGALPLQVGRYLQPEADGAGVVLRLNTAAYGRLLTESFELELVAVDLADNESALSSFENVVNGADGCSATGIPRTAPVGLLGLALLVLIRRRRGQYPRHG